MGSIVNRTKLPMNRNNNYEYKETLIKECDSSFQEYLVEIMNNQGNIDRSREL